MYGRPAVSNQFPRLEQVVHTLLERSDRRHLSIGLDQPITAQLQASTHCSLQSEFLPFSSDALAPERVEADNPGILADIPQMTPNFVVIVPPFQRQGGCIPFDAIR